MKNGKLYIAALMSMLLVFPSCSKDKAILPEDIINRAIGSENKIDKYYGEGKMKVYENSKLTEDTIFREWHLAPNKRRFEADVNGKEQVVSTFDGKALVLYLKDKNLALVDDSGDINTESNGDFKKQMMDQLITLNKTFNIAIKGEEKIAGHDTFHISAVPKEKNGILGNLDYWIDKENWIALKSVSESSNSRIEYEYTKIDFDLPVNDSNFTQKLPEDVKIQNMNSTDNGPETITIEQTASKLSQKVLYCSSSSYSLERIEYNKNNEEIGEDFNQVYVDKNGIEKFNISMKKPKDGKSSAELLPGETKTKVRKSEGSVLTANEFKCITWMEDGINYSVFTSSNDFSLEDCEKIAEELVKTK